MRLILGIIALVPLTVAAQEQASRSAPSTGSFAYGHKAAVPTAVAARRSTAISLDAKLDEDAWKSATPITDFRQVDPDEGQPASQRTEVRFLFDEDALYIGAKMYDLEGGNGVVTRLVRRDGSFDSDYLELVIDAYHDHLSRAFFDLNPSGSKDDYIGLGTSCCDNSWDPVWEAATHIDADGWTAEIRIPFSQLRFSRDSVQTWGLQVRRFIKRRNEQDQWSWWGKTESGGPQRFGHLEGLRMPASTSGLELLPYVVSKSSSVASIPNDPFNRRGRPSLRAGLDLKDRLTSNLTLDATFNPDFGQVEVDPAVLNLSAFETFFPEKRPFFVEGAQVFNFGGFSCNFCSNVEGMSAFYSRRIGRPPSGASLATDPNAFADVPDATTILAAGKITGRTGNGFTVGLLNALTSESNARVETLAGDRAKQEVEPLADYFVARLKRDYLRGNLVVGGVVSGVARKIDDVFAPRLARHAEMYGNDMYYTWHDQMYSFQANAAVTNVTGDARAIASRQLSSARYFQRPDRGDGSGGFFSNRFDPNATSLRGGGAYARIAKTTGDWFGELQTNIRTPGYETNDYAFQQRADYIWTGANIGRVWTKPTSWYRQIYTVAGMQSQNNFEGDVTQRQFHAYYSTTTPQFWNLSAFYILRPGVIDDRALRGGPAIRSATNHFAELDVTSDSRSQLIGNGGIGVYADEKAGRQANVYLNATYRPVSNVSVMFGPSFSTGRNYAQYVQALSDTTATSFYGTRYVVSWLDQRTLGLDTRLSVTFSPTMTLELYTQPFFAAGKYYDFKEYAAPRSLETLVYGRDRGTISPTKDEKGMIASYTVDPDGAGPAKAFTISNPNFSSQSLRGNAVFRWEYRPGSVLYVAWTQSRSADAAFGTLDFVRDRDAMFAARPDNIFLVKASWWLAR
jgi:uncharacterized protein DUF5916/cellulose/xylan binding protein with CBM9 domain